MFIYTEQRMMRFCFRQCGHVSGSDSTVVADKLGEGGVDPPIAPPPQFFLSRAFRRRAKAAYLSRTKAAYLSHHAVIVIIVVIGIDAI